MDFNKHNKAIFTQKSKGNKSISVNILFLVLKNNKS